LSFEVKKGSKEPIKEKVRYAALAALAALLLSLLK
jgi:hypothetical protein